MTYRTLLFVGIICNMISCSHVGQHMEYAGKSHHRIIMIILSLHAIWLVEALSFRFCIKLVLSYIKLIKLLLQSSCHY